MTSRTTLSMVDGVRVSVPDSLQLITPYVLREQEDWFEDEIRFLRRLLQPGQKVIDIGANYGLYTLSMAHTVGAGGHVWCFEPASGTAAFLAESIAANGFPHVTLEKSALSSTSGSAQLSLHSNSELNELVRGGAPAGASETVPLTTLDDCLDRFGWRDIAFMKIDAEGEEANILNGGQRFFATLSPLVEYEVKAGNAMHLDLIDAFAALGYRPYRLVPGLDLLIPFTERAEPDPYLLNLFCCKPDRAAELAAQGFLIDEPAEVLPSDAGLPADLGPWHWRRAQGPRPYGVQLLGMWESTLMAGQSADTERALALFNFSQDARQPAAQRFHGLQASYHLLAELCASAPGYLRQASLARAAAAYGARAVAVKALADLGNTIIAQRNANAGEPFLAPCARFEMLEPGTQLGNWLLGGVLEELERLSAFSSFYSGQNARQRLELINNLGFASAEMQRRLELVRQRFSQHA